MIKPAARYIIFTVFFLGFFCTRVYAQSNPPSMWLGVNGGYGLTIHSVNGLSCQNDCPQFNGGTGGGVFFGAVGDWLFAEPFGISLHADYQFSPLNMEATTSNVPTRDQNGNIVPLVRNYTLAVNVPEALASVSVFYKLNRLQFHLGPAAGLLINPTWSSSAHIVSPTNANYGNGTYDTTFFPKQSLPNVNTFQAYIMPGVSYDIPLFGANKNIMLTPEIDAYFPLTSVSGAYTWKETIIQFGAALKFGVGSEEKTAPPPQQQALPPPTVIVNMLMRHTDQFYGNQLLQGVPVDSAGKTYRTDTMVIGRTLPVAKLASNALYENNVRKKVSEIRVSVQFVTEAFPLLPFVFFDHNSSSLRQRYADSSSVTGFSTQALYPNPVVFQRNMLNIIGERMRLHPKASITISGYSDPTTENADCDLASARANAVRSYLASAWKIDPKRMTINTGQKNCAPDFLTVTKSEDGYAENRRVEIESNDPEILESIARVHYIEPVAITPPAIEFDPSGSTVNGIKSWRIEAKQGDRLVYADSGAGAPHLLDQAIGDSTAKNLRGGTPMIAALTITDSGGRSSVASDTIKVVKDTLETEVERLYLTLFLTSSDKITRKDSASIHHFMDGFDPADSVTILGYTDALGDTTLNKDLSERRAGSIHSLVHTITPAAKRIYSEGIAYRKYPPGIDSYSSPEERFLSRTVQIEVRKKHAP
ncbi:MAG TPA: OmpA family protein [Candidatus Kapabacteria bacterium]|nr:OmpA family protein [Candidatus Kapabacteria bacterium]